jgi:glycerol-3-phosphate acyltransferase PlsY
VGRTLGMSGFTVTFLFDLAKGMAAIWAAEWLGLRAEAIVASILGVIIGHNWPLQLRFQGGKGIAVSLGALLVYDPFIVFCLVVIFLPLLALLRTSTLAALLAYSLGPLVLFFCGVDKVKIAAMSLVAILVVFSHRRNIREEFTRMAGPRPAKGAQAPLHKNDSHEEG